MDIGEKHDLVQVVGLRGAVLRRDQLLRVARFARLRRSAHGNLGQSPFDRRKLQLTTVVVTLAVVAEDEDKNNGEAGNKRYHRPKDAVYCGRHCHHFQNRIRMIVRIVVAGEWDTGRAVDLKKTVNSLTVVDFDAITAMIGTLQETIHFIYNKQ